MNDANQALHYDVTLRRTGVTIVAVEKTKYIKYSQLVSVALS